MPAGPQRIGRSTSTSRRGSRHAGTGDHYLLTGKPIAGLSAGRRAAACLDPGSLDAGGDSAIVS